MVSRVTPKCGVVLVCVIAVLLLTPADVSAAPTARFTGSPNSGSAPLTVQFTDTSTGSPTGWTWYFGDESWKGIWTQVSGSAGWEGRNLAPLVTMPDGALMMTGGEYPDAPTYNDTWISVDYGENWFLMNASSGWDKRCGHAMAALPDGSVVITGGDLEFDTPPQVMHGVQQIKGQPGP